MKFTRRHFVQTLGAVAAITAADGCFNTAFGQSGARLGLSPISAPGNVRTLFSMKADQVRSFIGRSFAATTPDGITAELVLAEVNSARRSVTRGYSGECFSLIFKSRRNESFAQGVYEMRSEGIDQFSALLVPTGRKRREFELIVNHRKG